MRNPAKWQDWCASDDICSTPLPEPYDTQFTQFEKLLIMKILRPEKIMHGIAYYIENQLGKKYLELPSVSIGALHQDSKNTTPIIFILS